MKTRKLLSLLLLLILVSGLNFSAFAQGMKIVSPHPDLKFKITRCEAADKIVIIDFIIENINSNDVDCHLAPGSNYGTLMSVAYDDEANSYTKDKFKLQVDRSDLLDYKWISGNLPSEIPLKGRIQIEGVPESATEFKRIDLKVHSDKLGVGDFNGSSSFRITHLPIYREGDE